MPFNLQGLSKTSENFAWVGGYPEGINRHSRPW